MLALVQGLPPEAAVWRGQESSWTTRDEIQHSILDRILLQQDVKPHKLPDLRPGAKKSRGNVMSVSEFAAHYQQMRGGEQK